MIFFCTYSSEGFSTALAHQHASLEAGTAPGLKSRSPLSGDPEMNLTQELKDKWGGGAAVKGSPQDALKGVG